VVHTGTVPVGRESTMHWSAYEIFSVLSGLVLLIFAFVPGEKPSHRVWSAIGGLGFIGYGIFVATQNSGTFFFPVWIFLVPVAGIVYLVLSLATRGGRGDKSTSEKH
jgi:peptidoglycan/LPS O-acetylase OafA/YrhL